MRRVKRGCVKAAVRGHVDGTRLYGLAGAAAEGNSSEHTTKNALSVQLECWPEAWCWGAKGCGAGYDGVKTPAFRCLASGEGPAWYCTATCHWPA